MTILRKDRPPIPKNVINERYFKLVIAYAGKPKPNRSVVYVCKLCRHVTKTVMIDEGQIFAVIPCEACGKMFAWLKVQNVGEPEIEPDRPPSIEWFRPPIEDLIRIRKTNPDFVESILNGLLHWRRV